jgi:magnesium and cobalt transporter
MTEQNDTQPPQKIEPSSEESNNQNIFSRFVSYIKHWVKFHFFIKNKTVEESLNEVISEISMFKGKEMKDEERRMISDLIDFYSTSVDEIKIPRNEIFAVEEREITKVFEIVKENKISRIPVYRENLDNIVGFLNVKDLMIYFYENKNLDGAMSLIHEMIFVPPSMKAFDLLIEMKKKKIHIATIVDEYGGTDGIVTINNMISEIVGEIDDDIETEQLVKKITDEKFEISGRAELDDLKEEYGIDLIDEDFDEIETINGLILSINSSVPELGALIELPNDFECKIVDVSDRMVLKVLLNRKSI